ncbi:nitroreductase family protein [Streptomyces sp. NPDC046876]|uniref:nitroreductase family protein n=1 Tax=Streptomyces sp. NPDC046876 TaxID=3155616 RepID=UPI00340728F0
MSDLLDILAAVRQDAEAQSAAAVAQDPHRPGRAEAGDFPTQDFGALAEGGLRPALERRRANRFFAERDVDPALLGAMVCAGHAADAALWPDERVRPLEFLVVARAVAGLSPAVHRLGPDGFEPLAAISGAEELSTFVLQPEFAHAPALLLAVGSLEDALGADGSHGHRRLLERSGAACEAAWLTAVDAGLVGSIFAGFLPAALKKLVGIDGFRRTQLLALAVGHAVDASDEHGGAAANG